MPIKPENLPRYPADWKAIRERILARGHNRCELCFLKNGEQISRDDTGYPFPPYDCAGRKLTTIVLTTAHINQTPEDNRDVNLLALCQRCHLRIDQPYKTATAAATRASKAAALTQGYVVPEGKAAEVYGATVANADGTTIAVDLSCDPIKLGDGDGVTISGDGTIAVQRAKSPCRNCGELREYFLPKYEGCCTDVCLDAADLRKERDELRAFLDDEVMPRYFEIFEAVGLGEFSDSVIYGQARALLGYMDPPDDGIVGRMVYVPAGGGAMIDPANPFPPGADVEVTGG